MKVENPIDFVYVPRDVYLIPSLTLKENLFLEGLPSSLSLSKEFILQEFLASKTNDPIFQIFKKIPSLELYPHEVEAYQQKMICLLVALLKDSEFLFLEDPLFHFPSRLNIISHLKAILIQQSQEKARMVVIQTEDVHLWEDILTHTITRNSLGHYLVAPFEKTKDLQSAFGRRKVSGSSYEGDNEYSIDSSDSVDSPEPVDSAESELHFSNFSTFFLKSGSKGK